ncbi:MAG: hypothetical protein ABR511_14070 [Acidimicrobiales bacterium]
MADRLTTTRGGLERIEVRLADVVNRTGPRGPGTSRFPATGGDVATVAFTGTVAVPLADLQAMFSQVGEAQRRAAEAIERLAGTEAEGRRLADRLARTEAALAKARADLEDERRRGSPRASEPATPATDDRLSRYLRGQVVEAEARMAEARRELDGHRRRIRELEARIAASPDALAAARQEIDALRARLARADGVASRLRAEVAQHRQRVGELEAALAARRTAPPRPAAAGTAEPPPQRGVRRPLVPGGPGPVPEPAEEPDAPVRASRRRPPALARLLAGRSGPGRADGPGLAEDEADAMASRLRGLYERLEARRRDGGRSAADDDDRWVADLAAYDEALVQACADLGVSSGFRPGDRLTAADRVALTRALAAAGLDVSHRATG